MNTTHRYRSHHDSQRALAKALGVDRRRPAADAPGMEALLQNEPGKRRRGMYLHVPYCDRICTFCNMNRSLASSPALGDYAGHLQALLGSFGDTPYVSGRPFHAIYFGGGTPTALPIEQLAIVLSSVVANIPRADSCEWTVETTVHNLTPEKVDLLREAGVNRLSIGVQTFSDRGRSILGRTGDRAQVVHSLYDTRKRFDGTLGIDLIYSYPGQTEEEVRDDAEWVRRLDIDSVSFYSLMVHDGSVLGRRLAAGTLDFQRSVESDRQLHNRLYESLWAAGFELLELTKVARPLRDEYRYIKIRYDNGDLLPVGTGAGGRIGNHRLYRMAPDKVMVSPIDATYDAYNRVLGHLQYGRYNADDLTNLCGEKARKPILRILAEFESDGYLRPVDHGRWRLTPDGLFWGNNLAVAFLEHVISAVGACTGTRRSA